VLNDVITIDGTHVTGAGVDVTFTNCEALVVAGMGGDDTFYIENISIDTTVMGEGSLPVFPPGVTPPDLTGGAPPATSFNDTFYVGWAGKFVPGSLSGINATLTIEGDDGIDTAYIDNSADTVNRTFTLTATTLDSDAMGANGHIVYDSTVDNLNIQSGAGNDTFIVNGTGAGLQTTIWGAAGNDAFVVNAPLTTPLAINGDANTFPGDTLTINGTGFGNNFLITGFTVDGTGATISYATVETLTINGISGNNSFTLNGDSVPTFLNGGTDSDTFVVNASSAPAVLSGGAGNDSFIINGNSGPLTVSGDAGDDTFVVNGNSANLTLSGGDDNDSFTINGASSGILNVSGNDGNDTFVVNALSAPGALDGGAGDDSFTVNAPLAAALTISGGTGSADSLTVNGTSGNDFWVITSSTVGGVGTTLGYSNIDNLTVDGLNGNDTFNVLSTGNATTLITGAGLNTVNIGSLAPTMTNGTIAGIQGALTVIGNGNDVLNVDNTGSVTDQAATLTDSSLTGLGMAGITYNGIKTFNIALGQGGDALLVLNTAASTTTNVAGNGGDDVFNVQSTSGPLNLDGGTGNDTFNFSSIAPIPGGNVNAIAGQVNVVGGGGSDTVNVDDSSDTLANTGTLTASSLVGLGLGSGIGYSGITTLNIHIGSGDDTFNIQGTSAITTLNTGGGTNTINVGSKAPANHGVVDFIQGALTILGSENDTLNIDDGGSTVSKTGILTPDTLSGLGMASGGITFEAIRHMTICLGSGNDAFTVNEITNTTLTTIKGGAGQDSIALNFAGDYAAENLTLMSFETGTLTVGANFTGLLDDDGTLTDVSIGGSLATSGTMNVGGLGTVTIGSDLAGLLNDTGTLASMTIGGSITATGVLNAASISAITVDGSISGLVNDMGILDYMLVEGTVTGTGVVNADGIGVLIIDGDLAGIVNDTGSLNSATIRGSITLSGTLNAASIETLLIETDLAGTVNVAGAATTITIEGSISTTGILNAGSISSMTIDGDLAGLVNVSGLLDMLLVQGGTPGLVIAGDVLTITVQAGYGNKVLQVIEAGIERQIQALPIGGGEMPNDVLFAFTYDSTGSTPVLTIHISNESDTRFDLALVVHSSSARFDLALVDASDASGIGNISVEGNILGGAGGIRLPTDSIIGVEARDGLTVGSVHVAGLEGFAYGTLIWGSTKPVKITSEMMPPTVAVILGSNAVLLPATDAFRVPFSENHSVILFAETDHDNDLDLAATFTDTLSDGAGITAVIQMQPSSAHEDAVVIENLALLGNGASINTGASVANLTSTGAVHDIYIGGQGGLGNLTASAITGNITVAKGGITGTIQTTGILIDPITGAQTSVAGDIGAVVTGKNNKVSTTTITSKGGLSGQIIARGNIVSKISVHGIAAGSTIAAQGDIGIFQLTNSGNVVMKGGKPVRLGGITVTGADTGSIISLGNINADIRVTGTLFGRIAAQGDSNGNLSEDQLGILGNIKVGKFAGSAAVVSGGEIGDTALKTTLTAGKAAGIVAALGSVNLAHSTKVVGHLFVNLGSDDLLNASQVVAVFTDQSEPLLFDISQGDLQGLALIQQDLTNLSVDGDGNLTGANP
jgi:hypothetical protein